MATHVWTDGEAITASKLNALERKRAFLQGDIDFTKLTWAEAVALQEEIGLPFVQYGYGDTIGGDLSYGTTA